MPLNLGPGPVFIHESIAAETRRWQLYAASVPLFVLRAPVQAWRSPGGVVHRTGGPCGTHRHPGSSPRIGQELLPRHRHGARSHWCFVVAPAATAS